MVTRLEAAKKILLYWMDGSMVLIAVLYGAFIIAGALRGEMSAPRATVIIVVLLAFLGLFPFLMRAAFEHPPGLTPLLVVSGVLAAGLILLMPQNNGLEGIWMDSGVLWLGLAALYLRPLTMVWLSAVVVALVTVYVTAVSDRWWPGILLGELIVVVLMVGAMLLWRWLWWVIRDAHRSREARARLAVAEERLRFARDLHDLLGHSLSVITLKSELAAKLATKDEARAAGEMAAVRRLAGESLFEVQRAVHGYEVLDLEVELAGVRAALEAAGTTCEIETSADELSPTARTLLAWAVREGGTNILKHSTATRCEIRIDGGVLEMRNDGVTGMPSSSGNGLRGLSERLVTAGGSFSAEPTAGGEFLLRAAVPA